MFLPVLLLRDFGWLGWVIFAVPNVVGAAAMGTLVRSGHASRAMEVGHGRAMQAFALVTIAFQVYAVGGIFAAVGGGWVWSAVALLVVLALVPVVRRASSLVMLAPLVWLASVALVASGLIAADVDPLAWATLPDDLDPLHAVGLAIACLFGFGLCPYLDPTFHAARQLSDRTERGGTDAGPASFGVGFGVLFLTMIVGTLLYAPAYGTTLILAHVVMQASYTVACHRRAMADTHRRTCGDGLRGSGMSGLMWAGLLIALLVAVDLAAVAYWVPERVLGGYAVGEGFYRVFLGCYGLAFPAYVWLLIVGRPPEARPTRQDWLVYAVAVTLALPFFSSGFVGGSMIWTGVGLLIVLLAKGFVPRDAQEPGPTTEVAGPAA